MNPIDFDTIREARESFSDQDAVDRAYVALRVIEEALGPRSPFGREAQAIRVAYALSPAASEPAYSLGQSIRALPGAEMEVGPLPVAVALKPALVSAALDALRFLIDGGVWRAKRRGLHESLSALVALVELNMAVAST